MCRKRSYRTAAICVLGIVLLTASIGQAYDLPPVNLGFTSFLDGIPPAGPGWYFTEYVQYYTADTFTDGNGSALPFPDPKLDGFISLSQLIYQSDKPTPVGGTWGLDLIVPYVDIDAEYAAAGPFPMANSGGFGDLLVGPYIQWIKMGEKGPVFAQRVELQVLIPTGKYDNDKEINPSSNVLSLNPYWAGTLFMGPKWSASARVHYLWNDENDDPALSSMAEDVQAGQAVHANFAAACAVSKKLRVGVNGYYLKQLTETEADGVDIPDSEEQVFAIGPGVLYSFSQNTHLFGNAYFESDAENRTEGERYNVRLVHHF